MTSSFDPAQAHPTILVCGGRGFVGAAVVRHLLEVGWRVHVFGPRSPVSLPQGATETIGSIEDEAALAAVFAAARPTAVASFAAFSAGPIGLSRSGELDPERMMAINVLGFRRLLEACVAAKLRRIVWISSTVVFGQAEDSVERVDETAPRRPLLQYGLSKVLAEDIAAFVRRRHGLETIGLRIPLMLGPGLWYDGAAAVLKRMVLQAHAGARPRFDVPDIRFDAMHVADTGTLVDRLLRHSGPLDPIYNVAGFTTDYAEIAGRLASLVPGYAPECVPATPPIVYPLVSQARLERDTGWRHMRDLDQTLRDLLAERRILTPCASTNGSSTSI